MPTNIKQYSSFVLNCIEIEYVPISVGASLCSTRVKSTWCSLVSDQNGIHTITYIFSL